MKPFTLIAAVGGAGIVIAVGAAIFLLLGNDDEEIETRGDCGSSTYELAVERDEDNRMTASLEVKADAAAAPWTVTIVSNGKTVVDDVRPTDDEAELDVDAFLGTGEKVQDVEATFGPQGGDTCTAMAKLG